MRKGPLTLEQLQKAKGLVRSSREWAAADTQAMSFSRSSGSGPLIPLWRGCSEPCPRPESASRPDVACSERISVEGFVSSAAQENGLCESRFQERKEKVTITT